MAIYYILIMFICFLAGIINNMKDKNKRSLIIVGTSAVLIILIQGLRHETVGVDLAKYLAGLRLSKDMNFLAGEKLFNFEIGYSLYSQMFAKLNISEQGYLFVVAITIILPIAYMWIKNSKMPTLSILLYIGLGFFAFSFSGLRQAIAIGITCYSFKYIQEKDMTKFLVCIALASSFHITALIFIFAYPLYNIRFEKKQYIYIIPLFLFVFIFREQIFLLIYRLVKGTEGEIEKTGAFNMLIVMTTVLIFSYIFGSKDKKDLKLNAYRNYLLVAIFIQIFASLSNNIMRLGYYYYIFITLLIPHVISRQKNQKIKILSYIALVILLVAFFEMQTGGGYLGVSPYHFYWQK